MVPGWRYSILVVITVLFLTMFYYDKYQAFQQKKIVPVEYNENCECLNCQSSNDARNETIVSQFKNTTCSWRAFLRGHKQKVVSFTFYESPLPKANNRYYFDGIQENLALVKTLYPGYIMRLYFQSSTQETLSKLCKLAISEPTLDLCPALDLPSLGNATSLYPLIWRFLPVIDPQVDIFFSRDLDSRISEREVAAVKEFLNSEEQIHLMRDHPAHTAPIMGGMWGAKTSILRDTFRGSFKKMLKNGVSYVNRTLGGWDQIALQRFIWPWAKKQAFTHDSYNCKRFSYCHAFPTRRKIGIGNFVGSVISLNNTLEEPCPYKCRPKDHKDWTQC